MRNLVFGLGILSLIFSCNNAKPATGEKPVPMDFEILYQSEYGGSGMEKTEIFQNEKDFSAMWNTAINAVSGQTDVPKVDFAKRMVIAQHFKSRNSGGTTYKIQSVSQAGNKTEIYYTATAPDGMSTTAITNPLMIIAVSKTTDPQVEFKVQK